MIKWNDKTSTLGTGKKSYQFGDMIPAGLLSESRLEQFIKTGKVISDDPVAKHVEEVEKISKNSKKVDIIKEIDQDTLELNAEKFYNEIE